MVFVVAHYNNIQESEAIKNLYLQKYSAVVLCGTSNFEMQKDTTLAYHPIYQIIGEADIAKQHAYIDSMLRALQIEVPEAIIFYNKTMLDTGTVLFRIKEHCKIVGINIVEI